MFCLQSEVVQQASVQLLWCILTHLLLDAASLFVLMKLLSKVDQGTELGCQLSNLVTFLSCCFLAWIISVGAFAEWSAVMLMQMDAECYDRNASGENLQLLKAFL